MKKKYKILTGFGVFLIISLLLIQFYANSFVEKIVREEINKLIVEQKDNFHIDVGDINIQLLLNRFIVKGIKVQSVDSIPIKYESSVQISLDRIVVKLDNLFGIFTEKRLRLNKIELDKPIIYFIQKVKNDSIEKTTPLPIKSSLLKEIQLNSFEINDGELHIYNSTDSVAQLFTSLSGLDFKINDIIFRLNEEELKNKLSFDHFVFDLASLEYYDAKNHDISLDKVYYSNKNKGIKVGGFKIKSKAEFERVKNDFSNKEGWVDCAVKDISINLDFTLLEKNKINFKKIELDKLGVSFYQNKKDSSKIDVKTLLSNFPFTISIDTFRINEGNIDLSIATIDKKVDDYRFDNMFLNLNYLSNDSIYIENNPTFSGAIDTKLWSEGKLDIEFTYNLQQKKSKIKVKISDFPEGKLKQYSLFNNQLHFNEGDIRHLDLNFNSDSIHFEGLLKLDVSNLNVVYNHLNKNSKLNRIQTKLDKINLSSSFYKEVDKAITVSIDSIIINSPKIDLVERKTQRINELDKKVEKELEGLVFIDFVSIQDASFDYRIEGQKKSILSIANSSIYEKTLRIDLSKEGMKKITSSGFYTMEINNINFFKAPSEYISLKGIHVKKDKVDLIGFRYKNNASKNAFHASANEGNRWVSAFIDKVEIFSELDLLIKNELFCSNVKIHNPIFTYIDAIDRGENKPTKKKKGIDFNYPVTIENIEIIE
jgi:hypothetical protein